MRTSSADDQGSPLRIFIEPTRRGSRGQLYAVRLGTTDGPIIEERSLDPEHAACRYLVGQGLKGQLEVWSEGRASPRIILRSIEVAAGLSASEDDRKGVRLRKYRPIVEAMPAPSDTPLRVTAGNDNDESGEEAGTG